MQDLNLNRLQNLIVERDRLTFDTLAINKLKNLSSRSIAILYHANATAGEAGELANIAKKIVRDEIAAQGTEGIEYIQEMEDKAMKKGYLNVCDMRTQEAAKELADIIMHACLCAQALGVPIAQEVISKFNEVNAQYQGKLDHLNL
jgi:hypothetical protein